MIKKYSTDFACAVIDEDGIARRSGWIVVYCAHPSTREYLCATMEYLCVGSAVPAGSYTEKPLLPESGMALIRSRDDQSWERVRDLRGTPAWHIDTGQPVVIQNLGDLPANLTLHAPATSNDRWDGEMWVRQSITLPAPATAVHPDVKK